MRTAGDVRYLIHAACVWEASARKVGNVHPQRCFSDLSFADFVAAAKAIAPVLSEASEIGVGRSILEAVRASRPTSRSNANLGLILALAPLAAAARREFFLHYRSISNVLGSLTVDDARWTYQAIREAAPGGLGRAAEQDVHDEPTVTLLDAMRLAQDRDGIARQYATAYVDVRRVGAPALGRAIRRGACLDDAVLHCQLLLMANLPDGLIARKLGPTAARDVKLRARRIQRRLESEPIVGLADRDDVRSLDAYLRDPANARNPGTTADLVAASIFWALTNQNIPEGIRIYRRGMGACHG